jgi:hypothetical protein
VQNHPRRPVPLIILSILVGTTSLLAFLWLVLFPALLFRTDHLAAMLKPLVVVIFTSSFVLLGLVTAGGLWCYRAWAFRLGMILVVCTLALDLLWLVLSFSWDLFELGPFLLLALNGIILFFLSDPAVARAMVPQQKA